MTITLPGGGTIRLTDVRVLHDPNRQPHVVIDNDLIRALFADPPADEGEASDD